MQKPSIGRIVHYHSYGTPGGEYLPEPRAAVVTKVDGLSRGYDTEGYSVGLCVLNPSGMFFNEHVPFSVEPKAGHWSWPKREEA